CGNSPLTISSAKILQSNLLKYSCLGKERKLRESVSIPTKRLIRPMLERLLICLVIPSFWSWYHQAEPYCIFPAILPSLKLPHIAANRSLSEALRLYNIVLPSFSFAAKRSKKVTSPKPCE